MLTTLVGILGGIFLPLYDIIGFFYLIGSVFVPMIAIRIADFFLLCRERGEEKICWSNMGIRIRRRALRCIGCLCVRVDLPLGSTLPDMLVTVLLDVAVEKWTGRQKK